MLVSADEMMTRYWLSAASTTFSGLAEGRESARPSIERTAITGVKSGLLTCTVSVPAPSVVSV